MIWAYLKTDSTAYIERLIARSCAPSSPSNFQRVYRQHRRWNGAGRRLKRRHGQGQIAEHRRYRHQYLCDCLSSCFAVGAGRHLRVDSTYPGGHGQLRYYGGRGIGLDIGTAAVSAMAVGVRSRLCHLCHLSITGRSATAGQAEQALRTMLGTAGKAVVYVALAVGAGYSVLMLTGFGMHARLGFLVALAMAVSCAAAIIVLPALLYVWRPSFVFNTTPSSHTESTQSRQPSPRSRQSDSERSSVNNPANTYIIGAWAISFTLLLSPTSALPAELSGREHHGKEFLCRQSSASDQ